jgi:hypothetical protein
LALAKEDHMRWDVPVEMTAAESKVAKRLHRVGRFYVFLREIRQELFEGGFEGQLEAAYKKARGTEPLPPALLAMVTLLQAYDQVSDADAVVTAQMDKRWQLVLGCIGAEEAPFSQGALVSFRERMVLHDLDRKLLDRTVALAKARGTFGWQKLKVALDSSPLLGAGRVEDTWNLIGRALSLVVDCAAKAVGVPREEVVAQAKLDVLRGSSIKVALDIDWDDPAQQTQALQRLLEEVARAEAWVAEHAADNADKPPLKEALMALRRVMEQDLEPDPSSGKSRIRRGVARDRKPSLGDPDVRHGRKSKSKAFTGYKRHIAKAHGFIVAALVQPANRADNVATAPLLEDAARHGAVDELHIDRGFLGCEAVDDFHSRGGLVLCKPWPSRNHGRYTKLDFQIDLDKRQVTCPAQVTVPITKSGGAHFPEETCASCDRRPLCTVAKNAGRSIAVHPQERLLLLLRQRRATREGRAELRQRVTVEHSLAAIAAIQGPRARYKGIRKNSLDLRRCAAVANLQALRAA